MARRMGIITIRIVAGGDSPAIGAIAPEAAGIGDAMGEMDFYLRQILLPVIGMAVLEVMGIKAAKGIMREEQRPAEIRSQRQGHAIKSFAAAVIGAGAKAFS